MIRFHWTNIKKSSLNLHLCTEPGAKSARWCKICKICRRWRMGMMQNKICKTTFCQHTAGWLLIGQEEKEDKLLTDSILTMCALLVANLGWPKCASFTYIHWVQAPVTLLPHLLLLIIFGLDWNICRNMYFVRTLGAADRKIWFASVYISRFNPESTFKWCFSQPILQIFVYQVGIFIKTLKCIPLPWIYAFWFWSFNIKLSSGFLKHIMCNNSNHTW